MFALFAVAAVAADWPMLQGTEPGDDPDAVRPWGFVQAVTEGIISGEPARGLTSEALSPFEGQRALFNRVGSAEARWGFSIRRARLGLRGALPKTDGHLSWMLAAELGESALTRTDPVVLTDASVTLSYIPGAHVRVGQFKLPLGEEALEMNPLAAEFVNVSQPTSQLLLESPAADGAYTGGASGYRDVGVEMFDSFSVGPGEVSYALMLSNGRMGSIDVDDAKDVTGRIALTPWIRGDRTSAQREEFGLYGFWQQGQRTIEGDSAPRVRRGAGVKLEYARWHARVEIVSAAGAIESGPNPPFPGQPVSILPDGRAIGGHAYVHYQPGLLGAGLRYDELQRDIQSKEDLRVFRTLTLDGQVQIPPRAKILVDYERRSLAAPQGPPDARAIAETMGDKLSLQVAAIF